MAKGTIRRAVEALPDNADDLIAWMDRTVPRPEFTIDAMCDQKQMLVLAKEIGKRELIDMLKMRRELDLKERTATRESVQ